MILRPGAVTKQDIEGVIGSIDINHHQVKQDEVPKAPGMKYKHYAPNAQVYIVDPADDWGEVAAVIAQSKEQVGLMATDQVLHAHVWSVQADQFSWGQGCKRPAPICLRGSGTLIIKKRSTKSFAKGLNRPDWERLT